jgi:hypothetical protein
MRTLGVSASYPSPLTASTAGASLGLGEPLGGLSSSLLTQTHQPQTLGKSSRKQLVPQRDPAAADHLPCDCATREEELPPGALIPSAGLRRARLPLGS